MEKEIYFKIEKGLILKDLNETFPRKPSQFEISLSVAGHDKKLAKINKISTMLKSTNFKRKIVRLE